MNIPEIIKNKKAKSMSSSIKDAPSQLKIVSVHDAKAVLDQATISLFSSEPIDDYKAFDHNTLTKPNLPYNMKDKVWLTKMLQLELFEANLKISPSTVSTYVKHSMFFEQKLKDYQLKVVAWQIKHIKNGGRDWLIPKGYNASWTTLPDCDKIFRNGLVNTLKKLGVDKTIIEKGIEYNAELWKDYYMGKAFENYYRNLETALPSHITSTPLDPVFKDMWVLNRRLEYAAEHEESFNKYGDIFPEAHVSEAKAKRIKKFIDKKDAERKEEIKNLLERAESSKEESLKEEKQ